MVLSMVIAGIAGAVIPIALTRLGQDPGAVVDDRADDRDRRRRLHVVSRHCDPAVPAAVGESRAHREDHAGRRRHRWSRCSIVAVAIVAATFDPNDYKSVATDAFAARTGRTLSIDEDLRLAYFPWLAVETGGVTVGSAAAFGGAAQPFATARRVAARVKLLPLLSRRIEIGTVELEGLTLNLARDAELARQLARPARGGGRAASRAPAEAGARQSVTASRSRASASATAASIGARTPTSCATA